MVSNEIKAFDVFNQTTDNLKEEIQYIEKILIHAMRLENVSNVNFNVIIINNEEIKLMNKTYRNIDIETDVISFALEDQKDPFKMELRILGDIYISIDKARKQASEYEHSLIRELCFLSVHGFLHLLGYDHQNEEEEKIMFSRQEEILNEEPWARKE